MIFGGTAFPQSSSTPLTVAVSVQKDVMVKLRDGVLLATDLYLPVNMAAHGTRLPVILHRTPYDQRERKDLPGSSAPHLPLRSRNDLLVFETAPLAEDTVIAGPVEVTLYASITGTDTDFTAGWWMYIHPARRSRPVSTSN